jgi:hemolysin activation/secretion protein
LSILAFACALAGMAPAETQAQSAGMELQGPVPPQPQRPDPAAMPQLPPPSTAPEAPAAAQERRIALKAVRFEGNQALSSDALQAVVGPLQGRRFTLAELYQLAERITTRYRAAGFPLAQALVPAQRMADDTLTIRIIEGTIGAVSAAGTDPKVPGAQPFLEAGVPVGAPIRGDTLERTMLLLDDQPGFRVRPVLKPGAGFGETDLVVNVERRNQVSGEIGLDNTGNHNTGEYRLRGALNINSPFRFGDRLSFTAMVTDQMLWLGSADYETPLDAHGTRGAVGLSRSSYQLGGAFTALEASGVADTLSLRVSHPVLRSQRSNLLASVTLAHKRLEQRFDAVGVQRERQSELLTAALQFDHRDAFGGGGVSYGQVSLSAGHLRLDDSSRALDQTTARTEGEFQKINLDLSRIQKLPGLLSAYARASAQWSPDNLDPSEKFGLGGFLGVRAYPMGEGSGDRAWLTQFELRMAAGPATTAFAWADAGEAIVNARPWDSGSDSRRRIAGAGLGARWGLSRWSLESTLGWRLRGGRPEAESRDPIPRLFVVGGYRFD